MLYKKITELTALTAITDDDLLVAVNSPASGPTTNRITWAQVLAYFATGSNVVTVTNAGLHILDTDASHDLIIKPGSNLTADRILTITTGDAARTVTLGGDLSIGGAVAIANAFSTVGAFSIELTATAATTITLPTTGTLATTSNKLSDFAATTSAELAGVISDETGTGAMVFANTPTLVTPVLGAATATTINKVTITQPAAGSTLTIQDGFTLTASGNSTINQSVATTASPTFAGLTTNTQNNATSGSIIGYTQSTYTTPASASTALVVGASFLAEKNGTSNLTGGWGSSGVIGVIAKAVNRHAATLTNAYSIVADCWNITAGGTITNSYQLYIPNPYVAAGAITNVYGIYLANLTSGSTTNYAIYSAGGQSYHAGNFGFGAVAAATPSAPVHIIKTTEQFRAGYDASNYFTVTVGSTGTVTLDATGAGAGFVFSDSCRFNGGTASSDGTAGATADVAVAKVGGGTRTLSFKNGLYTGYVDS